MPRFTYTGACAAVEVPLLGRVLERGDEFEVDDDLAPKFAEQPDNYTPVEG